MIDRVKDVLSFLDAYPISARNVVLGAIAYLVIVWLVYWSKSKDDRRRKEDLSDHVEKLKSRLKNYQTEPAYDDVTGIPNQGKMIEELSGAFWDFSKGTRQKLTLVYLDLKNFKKGNSDRNVLGVNRVIRAFARTIHDSMRRDEELFKFDRVQTLYGRFTERFFRQYRGGDEFLFIFHATERETLTYIKNRLKRQCEKIPIRSADGTELYVVLEFHAAVREIKKDDVTNLVADIHLDLDSLKEITESNRVKAISDLKDLLWHARANTYRKFVVWQALANAHKDSDEYNQSLVTPPEFADEFLQT